MGAAKKFGLIGQNISYSFSGKYFTEKFRQLGLDNYSYKIFDFNDLSSLRQFCEKEKLSGFNVTIPFKEKIIPLLDSLSEEAKMIRAVNTVAVRDGHLRGYNTDASGFEATLMRLKQDHHRSALVLGNGGAAKAVQYVLKQHQITYNTVYRKGALNFDTLTAEEVQTHKIIVQTTPVGTYPNIGDCLKFPFEALSPQHVVIDLIYNPSQTLFLRESASRGATTANGQMMLEQQAEKAWEIWNREA